MGDWEVGVTEWQQVTSYPQETLMPILLETQYPVARPLFPNLSRFHLCGWAVLHGAAPGSLWVDDANQPRVGVLESSEGCYLAGDPGCTAAYTEIKKAMPPFAYLICDPPAWEQALGRYGPT